VFDKFNFYDVLGYLLPGAVVVLVLYWFGRAVLALPVPTLPTDLGGSFLFIGLSYIVGQVLVQGTGSRFEDYLNRKDKGRLSERLLLNADTTFTPDLKARIQQCAKETFKVVASPSDTCVKDGGISRAELFGLVYAWVVQKDLGAHAEIFEAISGLSRGMYVAAWLGLFVSAVTLALELGVVVYHDSGGTVPSTGPFARNLGALALGAIGLVVFAAAIRLARYRYDRFRKYFATSVYYNFVAACAAAETEVVAPGTPAVGGPPPSPAPVAVAADGPTSAGPNGGHLSRPRRRRRS
jgi:hypothetical protein